MYIKRNLEDTIQSYLHAPEILAVVGPRQAGKTCMISHVFTSLKRAVSISFDDQKIVSLFEKNIDNFITAYVSGNDYLFIDEFQYARNGGKLLKYIYDTQKIKLVISGSSAIDLTVRTVKYLVGRIFILHLYPFDFREFLSSVDEPALKIFDELQKKANLFSERNFCLSNETHTILSRRYEEYLVFGGYPRVVLEQNTELKKEILKNIYNTYFLREVRDILGLIDDYKLANLVQGLALQIGNLVEYNELSRLSGLSFAAVKKYMNFFEKTFICRPVKPYYTNKRTEIVKNPKIFFFDTGLRNSVIDDFRRLDSRTDAGVLLENGIAMQAIKKNYSLNYWRDKKKHEVDFIMSMSEGRKIAIESKQYAVFSDARTFTYLIKSYPAMKTALSYLDADTLIKNRTDAYPEYLL